MVTDGIIKENQSLTCQGSFIFSGSSLYIYEDGYIKVFKWSNKQKILYESGKSLTVPLEIGKSTLFKKLNTMYFFETSQVITVIKYDNKFQQMRVFKKF